jgi:hypothetical protein
MLEQWFAQRRSGAPAGVAIACQAVPASP